MAFLDAGFVGCATPGSRGGGRLGVLADGQRVGGTRMGASPEAVGMSAERLERIHPVMESYIQDRGFGA